MRAKVNGRVLIPRRPSQINHPFGQQTLDRPLAVGSTWLQLYGVEGTADDLTRITVDGCSTNTDWLKVRVHRSGPGGLTREQIPYR